MSNGFNYDTREIIFGLKSKLGRRDDTITALNERIAVLENLVQSTSDDRDGYMERAVEIEQRLDAFQRRVNELLGIYRQQQQAEPTLYNAGALDAVGIIGHLFTLATDQILADVQEQL